MNPYKLAKTWAVAVTLPLVGVLTAFAAPQDGQPATGNQTEPSISQKSRPTPNINKQLASWHEAGPNGVGSTLRANWIVLNATDGIDGQISGISESINVFLLRNGFVVGETVTLNDGTFRLESATPGPYTIVGYSAEAIFSYSFNAVSNDGTATGMPTSLQPLPILGKENNRLVARLLGQHSPSVDFRDYGDYDIGEAETDPSQHYGWNGLGNLTDSAVPSTGIHSQSVSLVNGNFIGRIHQMHNRSGRPVEVVNTRVMVIQDGELIAEVQANSSGIFVVDNLAPGYYGMVAIGNDGFAGLGVELVAGDQDDGSETTNSSEPYDPLFRNISYTRETQSGGSFDVTLGSPESIGWVNSYVAEQNHQNALDEPLPEMSSFDQMPYDYFDPTGFNPEYGSNFGGGGGGGYGGGFGGGGLLLPLGLGAIIADAIDDNNNNLNGGVRLISPFDP